MNDAIPTMMQAVVADRYGAPADVMEERRIPIPAVGSDDVLVAVRATSLQALDWHLLRGDPLFVRLAEGLRRPERTVHGVDVAGVVAAIGAGVVDLAIGDEVFGWSDDGGGLAEYVRVPRDHLRPVPSTLTVDEAGTIGVAAFTALQAVRDAAEVRAGERVLVVGASGGVGHYVVQLCVAAGAHVTGVCSASNHAMVQRLGAEAVIDRHGQDWTASEQRWDVVVQVAGDVSYRRARRALDPGGRYVMVGFDKTGRILGPALPFLRLLVRSRFDRRVRVVQADENPADLAVLADLLEAGTLRPVIDRRFPIADAVEAMSHVDRGRAVGKIVVTR